jgi:hypothetical protein
MDLRRLAWAAIQFAQDRDWWRAVVNALMNLRVLVPRSYHLFCRDVNIVQCSRNRTS